MVMPAPPATNAPAIGVFVVEDLRARCPNGGHAWTAGGRAGRVADAVLDSALMFVCAECGASQPVPGNCTADGQALQPIGDDPILGATIGPYRVARLLGVGGMGRVYKGVHPTIGSRV